MCVRDALGWLVLVALKRDFCLISLSRLCMSLNPLLIFVSVLPDALNLTPSILSWWGTPLRIQNTQWISNNPNGPWTKDKDITIIQDCACALVCTHYLFYVIHTINYSNLKLHILNLGCTWELTPFVIDLPTLWLWQRYLQHVLWIFNSIYKEGVWGSHSEHSLYCTKYDQ